ncbi:MAG: THUMP domain-containing class I SAM-dependent RNA methyltransferase [Halobacteriota archaeon]|uniref:THUMP domain-containing class I SAM-dependent RNA methyltransferase n=1 Tax=Natronomonas sp. TaxID=2184060 RepID=UPI003976071D
MKLLATTNGGLEAIAAAEVRDLVGCEASVHHRGVVEFDADVEDVYALHYRSRTLHRLMAVVAEGTVTELEDVYALTARSPIAERLPETDFGVVGTRHGSHDFTSVDVAERVGQATIDAYRDATGTRLPVDLDDPTVRLEAYLYDDRFTLAVDLTGDSLHKRPHRICEHDAPVRATLACSMLRIAEWTPDDRLVDPMAGSATIPIEAALAARRAIPRPDLDPAFEVLPGYDGDRFRGCREEHTERSPTLDIEAREKRKRWRNCARVNRGAAGVENGFDVVSADAREASIDADCVVSNLPFGIRTGTDLRELYGAFVDRLREGDVGRLVALTTKPELLPLEPTDRYDIPYGRLDATIVVWKP